MTAILDQLCDNYGGPGGAGNTIRSLTHSLDYTEEGLAMQATRTCMSDGCVRPAHARGFCNSHYERMRKAGGFTPKPSVTRRAGESNETFRARQLDGALKRLEANSTRDGNCIVWNGFRNPRGYGLISMGAGRRADLAHRIAWIARHGEPPSEMPYVLHRCDNPPCWNDEHLFLGTHDDNMADMASKHRHRESRKTHCPQGHPYDKANTRVSARGWRYCRACQRIHADRRASRRRAGLSTDLSEQQEAS